MLSSKRSVLIGRFYDIDRTISIVREKIGEEIKFSLAKQSRFEPRDRRSRHRVI